MHEHGNDQCCVRFACKHTYMYACTFAYMHACIHTHKHYTWLHTYIYTHVPISHTHHTCMQANKHACIHTYIYIHTRTHTLIDPQEHDNHKLFFTHHTKRGAHRRRSCSTIVSHKGACTAAARPGSHMRCDRVHVPVRSACHGDGILRVDSCRGLLCVRGEDASVNVCVCTSYVCMHLFCISCLDESLSMYVLISSQFVHAFLCFRVRTVYVCIMRTGV
jgi:hypothetical protein